MEFKGVIGIVCTPYNPDMTIDFESLKTQTEFILKSGAHGISFPIMASEFFALTMEERKKGLEIIIDITNGEVPVYAGISGHNIFESFELAEHAAKAGADCLVAMTPLLHNFDETRTFEFFNELDKRVDKPIMLQNLEGFGAVPLSIPRAIDLIGQSKNLKFLKEETPPSILKMEMAINAGKGKIEGVYGGWGGLQLLDELELGSKGTLIACEFIDIVAKVYDLWEAGNKEEANTIFQRVLPALVYETKMIFPFWLTVLQKRGIIKHNQCRAMTMSLTPEMHKQVDRFIDELEDLMIEP